MDKLESIAVRVEGGLDEALRTENVGPLLPQIEQALQDLQETGSETVIDLGAMPFSAQDEQDLRERLGRGEVNATVEAFGPTLVQETAFAGVWLVEYLDAEQRRLTLHLQVARIPELLITPADDLADSLASLRRANRDLSAAPTEDVQ
ncbi:MAG: hydrogenase expression/formation C-terminal domain-containing protein [Sedimenticolaceae bacterium]